MQSHSTQYARLLAEHAHFRGKLRPAGEKYDEMSTKTSRILVLVSITSWIFVIVLVPLTIISDF